MSQTIVLDASALLALIQNEAGAEVVTLSIMQNKAIISAINWSEVIAKLAEAGMAQAAIAAFQAELPIDIVPFDEVMALDAGLLRPVTRHLGLSLGDRACLATAKVLGNLCVLTADNVWDSLKLDLEVRQIR
jgi:PIN domain nuclease of toxin-antitoxin system